MKKPLIRLNPYYFEHGDAMWNGDGLIEAIEDIKIPDSFLAVQWHPEFMLDDDDQIKLFKWLVLES